MIPSLCVTSSSRSTSPGLCRILAMELSGRGLGLHRCPLALRWAGSVLGWMPLGAGGAADCGIVSACAALLPPSIRTPECTSRIISGSTPLMIQLLLTQQSLWKRSRTCMPLPEITTDWGQPRLMEYQCDFRPQRGCSNQLFSVRWLSELAVAKQRRLPRLCGPLQSL